MGLYIFKKNRADLLLAVLILALPVFPLQGDTKILEGEMSFRFRVESGNSELLDDFFEYENNSNSQKVIERGDGYVVVENRALLMPFETGTPFPPADRYTSSGDFPELAPFLDYSTSREGIEIRSGGGELVKRSFVEKKPLTEAEIGYLQQKAREITAGAQFQHQAVEKIMRYIRENVGYTLQSSANPVEVLRTGRAYCEGYANAGALLLRVMGIPAKVVDSYIPPGHMWGYGQQGGGGFHAHVEVYYEDAGWVSYDPQATVHFVDPFHIVEYPRERTRLIQLSESDDSRISDILAEPEDWNNFFQRDTTRDRNGPVFVGTIHDSSGTAMVDSFRSNVWVYLRKNDGGGEGVRILPTGEFALAPSSLDRADLAEPRTFFFRDGRGGWIEEEIRFNGRDYLKKDYRLDDPSSLITLNLAAADGASSDGEPDGAAADGASAAQNGGPAQLYLWYPSVSASSGASSIGRWKLDAVESDPTGRIRLISSGGSWIVGTDRTETAPKYRLDASLLKPGREYFVGELPRYLEPDRVYLNVVPPYGVPGGASGGGASGGASWGRPGGLQAAAPELTFLNIASARRYQPLRLDPDLLPIVMPNSDFSTLVLNGESLLALTQLKDILPPGKVSIVDMGKNSVFFELRSSKPNYPVYLAVKRGRRFSELARGRTDAGGRLNLYLDRGLFEEGGEELHLLHGTPIGSKRLMLTSLMGGVLDLDG